MNHRENVENVIAEIESIRQDDPFGYEKILLTFTKVKQLPIFIDTIYPGNIFFRTRSHTDDILFKHKSEISNPKKEFVTRFARCNRPLQSVFYGSETRPVSYLELVDHWVATSSFGSKFYATIGRWELTHDINAVLVLNTDPSRRTTEFEKHFGKNLDAVLNRQSPEIRESSALFLNYIDSKFSLPAKDDLKTYLITAAYTNLALLHAGGSAEAIVYQSVPAAKMGINIAICSDAAHKLELTHVLRDGFESQGENGKHQFMQVENVEAKGIKNDSPNIEW